VDIIMPFAIHMALFGLFKKPGQRKIKPMKPGQKIEYKPTIGYNPAKASKNKVKKTNRKPGFNWKLALASLASLAAIAAIVFGIVQVLRSDQLRVEHFVLLGNRTISDNVVLNDLQGFRSQSMLLVNTNTIEQKLLQDYNIFSGVEVDKFYPDTLFIKISEREPKLVYINLSGAFLLDAHGQVLQQIYLDPVLIPDEEINIARGLGDPQSDFLKDLYLNDFLTQQNLLSAAPADQQTAITKSFDFTTIALNDKLTRLTVLQKQYLSQFYIYWDKIVDTGEYSSYPRVDSFDSQVWKQGDLVNIDRLQLTSDLLNLFANRKINLTRIIWEGELLVRVVTTDNKTLVFGTERDVTQQFEDYLLVVDELEREGHKYCQVDVSTSKIAVQQCK
jgi:cell division septal protein FtsQ